MDEEIAEYLNAEVATRITCGAFSSTFHMLASPVHKHLEQKEFLNFMRPELGLHKKSRCKNTPTFNFK